MFGENLHILLSGLRWFSPSLSCHLLPSIAIYCHLQDAHLRWEDMGLSENRVYSQL
jgi:hypothetical protein